MTSSTISVNFDDTADKTVFTATEKCILKLIPTEQSASGRFATFKLNSTNIGNFYGYYEGFKNVNISLANLLTVVSMRSQSECSPTALILYLEEGDTVYAYRTSSNAFTLTLYSAVFTF